MKLNEAGYFEYEDSYSEIFEEESKNYPLLNKSQIETLNAVFLPYVNDVLDSYQDYLASAVRILKIMRKACQLEPKHDINFDENEKELRAEFAKYLMSNPENPQIKRTRREVLGKLFNACAASPIFSQDFKLERFQEGHQHLSDDQLKEVQKVLAAHLDHALNFITTHEKFKTEDQKFYHDFEQSKRSPKTLGKSASAEDLGLLAATSSLSLQEAGGPSNSPSGGAAAHASAEQSRRWQNRFGS